MEKVKLISIVDKIILFFIVLFLVTLTNSIFVNQLGYYGALLSILIRFIISKENKFSKTGLEIPFILFLLAELISSILSDYSAQSFHNLLKRFLLIPIVYTIYVSVDNPQKAKLFFKVYIIAAVTTSIFYIAFAYEHFVSHLYQLAARGPSPFQYVMTAGGLISFSVVFLFAFLFNEKTKPIFKTLILIAFFISLLALLSSYTRAAWMGTAAGLFFILLIKRRWIVLTAFVGLIILAASFPKTESKIFSFSLADSKLNFVKEFRTDGRAYDVLLLNDTLFVADYQDGLKIYSNEKLLQSIATPSPATGIKYWKENYFALWLVDSRILLLEKTPEGMKKIDEFASPGRSVFSVIRNDAFYIADDDSGLTVFRNPKNLNDKFHFGEKKHLSSVDADSNYLIAFYNNARSLVLYQLKDKLPTKKIDSIIVETAMGFVWINNGNIFLQNLEQLQQYEIKNNKLTLVTSFDIRGTSNMIFENENILVTTVDGDLFKIDANNSLSKIASVGFSPMSVTKENDKFYFSLNKRNRIASMIDPYHETNLERINIWHTGFKILKDHLVFGVGDIDLGKVYSEYKAYYLKENFGHMHNNYVHLLVTLGLFGFAVVSFLLIKIFLIHIKIYNSVKEIPFASSYALGALASFVTFLVSGLAEWNFGDHEIITMIWFILGLNLAFYKQYTKTLE